jgi:hypothetical protein
MTTNNAITFAIETVKNAKVSMIENGISNHEMVYAVCKKLAVMLNLDLDTVVTIMEKA